MWNGGRAPKGTPGPTVEFGTLNGEPVYEISIASMGGLKAIILTLGGIIRKLEVPLRDGTLQDVVLGYDRLENYARDTAYLGAIVGRYANRIANGGYSHEGKTYWVDRNENGKTSLHGGTQGFSRRHWRIADFSNSSVTLRLTSVDGDQGFPGTLMAQCKYSFNDQDEFRTEFSAHTDFPTPVNLSQHTYFNLDGSADIGRHSLQVFADEYTPTTPDLIPTGQVADVTGTGFDFRTGKLLQNPKERFDCNLVLNKTGGLNELQPAAVLRSGLNGLTMKLSTTKPGLQFYDGHQLAVNGSGKGNRSYGANAGLCLETQFFPDSPNKPGFPDAILRPGSVYHHVTELQFTQE